jgi:hypothetical protein
METVTDKIDALKQERKETVIRLLQTNTTYQRIGEMTGLSITSVMAIAHKNDIRRGKTRKDVPDANAPVSVEEMVALMDAVIIPEGGK